MVTEDNAPHVGNCRSWQCDTRATRIWCSSWLIAQRFGCFCADWDPTICWCRHHDLRTDEGVSTRALRRHAPALRHSRRGNAVQQHRAVCLIPAGACSNKDAGEHCFLPGNCHQDSRTSLIFTFVNFPICASKATECLAPATSCLEHAGGCSCKPPRACGNAYESLQALLLVVCLNRRKAGAAKQ